MHLTTLNKLERNARRANRDTIKELVESFQMELTSLFDDPQRLRCTKEAA
jgi:hypothetical protein